MTCRIVARDLSVHFPIYEQRARSLRHHLVIDRVQIGRRTNRLGGDISTTSRGTVVVNALDTLNFTIEDGDRVGLIGHNGAGKSTLLKVLAGIYEPVAGELNITGSVTPMLNMSEGMDGDITGMEYVALRGRLMGMSEADIQACMEDVREFTELGDYLALPIRSYSSGMSVRLAFAIATAIQPDILLMDEMIGAGDAAFVAKAEARVRQFVDRSRILIVASHNPGIIETWCNKAILLEHGRVRFYGPVQQALEVYREGTQPPVGA